MPPAHATDWDAGSGQRRHPGSVRDPVCESRCGKVHRGLWRSLPVRPMCRSDRHVWVQADRKSERVLIRVTSSVVPPLRLTGDNCVSRDPLGSIRVDKVVQRNPDNAVFELRTLAHMEANVRHLSRNVPEGSTCTRKPHR